MTEFSLWLEFEELDSSDWDARNEITNAQVTLSNGKKYGLNIWSYGFLDKTIREDTTSGSNLNGLFQIPPDLLVQTITRNCIEKSISELLKEGELSITLNPSIIIDK